MSKTLNEQIIELCKIDIKNGYIDKLRILIQETTDPLMKAVYEGELKFLLTVQQECMN